MRKRLRIGLVYLALVGGMIMVTALPALMAGAASLHPGKASLFGSCKAGWVYDHIVVTGIPLQRVGPAYQNINATNGPALSIFVEATSDTVIMSINKSLTVSTTVVLSAVTASTRKSVTEAITVTSGNLITLASPAHTVAHAEYGVYMVQTSGHYYYRDQFCNAPFWLDQGIVTSSCPWYAGWHIWTTGPGTLNQKSQLQKFSALARKKSQLQKFSALARKKSQLQKLSALARKKS